MKVPWYLMAKGKGGGGYKTASGPIVSVNDALAAPLRSLLVNVEPVQEGSGDPSPDNVRPISGWSAVNVWRTGGNLLSSVLVHGLWTSDGLFYSHEGGASKYITTKDKIPVKGGETYCVSFVNDPNNAVATMAFNSYHNGEVVQASIYINMNTRTIAVSEEADEITMNFVLTNAITSISDVSATDFQIELGSTATPYEPYSGHQYTIQLGQTVYGATLDVTNGVLTVDRVMKVFNGASSEGWTKSEYNYFTSPRIGDAINRNATPSDFQSNLFPYGNITNTSTTLGACLIWAAVRVRLADMSISLDDWNAQLASTPMQVVYTLATPIEIPLTPTEIATLQGQQNNVWADAGDVTVEYLSSGGANPDLMKLAVAFMGRK